MNPLESCSRSLHGFEETEPCAKGCEDGRYFPLTFGSNLRASQISKGSKRNVTIAVTIPCYNEEANALRRTLDSLMEQQDLPAKLNFKVAIVMDGVQKIAPCMKMYLQELLGIEKVSDPSMEEGSDPFFEGFSSNINTVVIETTQSHRGSAVTLASEYGNNNCSADEELPTSILLDLSLVVKRHNQKKVNSQMWSLAAHARACRCDFALLTDCGTVFDKKCLFFLMEPMLCDENIGVTTGSQTCMSAVHQGCGELEWWHKPGDFILRQSQAYDFASSRTLFKSLYNRLGFLPVVPGPCGLYRYSMLGTLESRGVMQKYFDLSFRQLKSSDLVLGNSQLAEDRFPGNLLTFQSEIQCKEQNLPKCPRVQFIPDAIFSCEAELPLSALVKQRRRWNNGMIFSAVWFLSADWLWSSNHSVIFKTIVYLSSTIESILGPLFFAVLVPPIIACSFFGITSGFVLGDFKTAYENPIEDKFELSALSLSTMLPSVVYMIIYIIFVIGHIPRAVKVKQDISDTSNLDQDLEEANMSSSKKHLCEWRADRQSAYRPQLWKLAIFANIIAGLIVTPWLIISIMYHMDNVPLLPWMLGISYLAILAAFLDGILNYKTPTMKHFLDFALRVPFMFCFGIFFAMSWMQSYSFARISDLSWGNRDGAHEQNSNSKVAKQRAHLGKIVALALLFMNVITFTGLMYWSTTNPFAFMYAILLATAPTNTMIVIHSCASIVHGLYMIWMLVTKALSSSLNVNF